MRDRIFIMGVVVLILSLAIQEAGAIPAFARRYKVSCSTCHAPFPKLKPYGDDFAGSGFILKEEEKARDYVTAGDDILWLNRYFPIAVRFDAYMTYEDRQTVNNDLGVPWGLKIMSGGTVFKSIGYYFYFYLSEQGEVAGIEDAYIHFDNIFKSPLDIIVGQFQTSDPLMKRELRLTLEDYMIYKQHVGLSSTNLAYDRGIMLLLGLDKTGTDIIGMVVNGNGKPEAGEGLKFDRDKYKNFGLRIAQAIGSFASIGGFYYWGKEEGVGADPLNTLSYWGPDLNIAVGPIEFTGQYLERRDSNPIFSSTGSIKTRGIVAEAIFAPKRDRSRIWFTALYNQIDSGLDDLADDVLAQADVERIGYRTATLSISYLVARNLRFVTEYTRDLKRGANRFALGMVTGF